MKSKIIGGIGAIFITILIVSTATAIPYINSQSVNKILTSVDEIRNQMIIKCLSKFLKIGISNETMLIAAIIFLTIAWICYSIGIIVESSSGILKPWHVKLFWLGLLFELTGATLMFILGKGEVYPIHMIVGAIALALIIFHNILASIIIKAGNTMFLKCFPKFSLTVYLIWLIAFITGMIIGMKQDHGGYADILGV